ncbi:hypothetical protein RLDS_16805 [Sphingobium lactosutens DS20]|uniref:Fumarylacetoacetase-like C-terminal domain-containing protein n=2 Tax=Sphingobium TaxID=165695 RepID=T0HMK1_9SPHN|nr:hypothetical protein RLDS_16805 [Sphingobium lactosutens DS20]
MVQNKIAKAEGTYAPEDVSWLPPIDRPSKMAFLALNNRSLDAVKIRAPTDHPAFFLKPFTALTGHGSAVRLRQTDGLTHPEPELGVVIGSKISRATPSEALDAIFGYSIINDVTSVGMREEDSFSFRFFKPDAATGANEPAVGFTTYPGRYKASDTFAPMGPFIVTRDEVPNPADLTIRCWMDDRLIASDHTGNYTWSVGDALSHISQTMTLLPGDVVSMGTAVGGDNDDPDAPDIPGVTRANMLNFNGSIHIEIERLGRLSVKVAMQ